MEFTKFQKNNFLNLKSYSHAFIIVFITGERLALVRDVDIYNNDLIQDGVIVYGWLTGAIDRFGNEIWNTGEEGSFDFILNHINEFGNIYGLSGYNYPNNTGAKINYDRDFLWSAPTVDPAYAVDIHEIKQIPNGNYMAFVPDVIQLGSIPEGPWTVQFQALGYEADGITNEFPWLGLRLVEWDEETREEVWSWDPFEHFTMDDYDLYGGVWWGAYFYGFFDMFRLEGIFWGNTFKFKIFTIFSFLI